MCEYVETIDRITYTIEIEPEDVPVRGNAMASGDDDLDREVEDEILAKLDRGNLWAWCAVKVTASFDGFTGHDYLGGCSYNNVKDFIDGGCYADMRDQAKSDLIGKLGAARQALHKLETGL